MKRATKTNRYAVMNVRIHPVFRRQIKLAAAEGPTITEVVHAILCKAFNRPDLKGEVPRKTPRPKRVIAS